MLVSDFFSFVFSNFKKRSWCLFASTAATALLINFLTVVSPLLQKRVIDGVSIFHLDNKAIGLLIIVTVGSAAVSLVNALILNALFMSFKNSIERGLLESVTRKRNKTIEDRGAGGFMVSIFGDSEQIASLIGTNYFSILIVCIANILILLISLRWSVYFSVIVVLAYFAMAFILIFSNRMYVASFANAREKVFELNPKVLEFIENRDSIVGYSNIIDYEKGLNSLFLQRDNFFKSAFGAHVAAKSLIDAVKSFALIFFFVLSMRDLLSGEMLISEFIALLSYFSFVFMPVSAIQDLNAGMNRFKTLKAKISDNLLPVAKTSIPESNCIAINDCSYSVKSAQQKNEILSGISLSIDKKIAIVGLSGEGKTTLIKLVLGELEPSSGSCTIGSTNVGTIPKAILRSSIRLYKQDPELFDNDLEFNITLGKHGITLDQYQQDYYYLEKRILDFLLTLNDDHLKNLDTEIEKIIHEELLLLGDRTHSLLLTDSRPADLSFAASLLANTLMSKKYYVLEKYNRIVAELELGKLLGRSFGQRGANISGGEKNKVCLARFMLPEYEQYFILDEPLANLDLKAEKGCLLALKNGLANFKGGIIISHKLNIVNELADTIMTLENGKITGSGPLSEMLENSLLYKELHAIHRENSK